ncbi:MAG: hypothetical protein Q9228_001609 [Teloschistes exilis]
MSFETPLPPYNASDPYATFVNSSCFDLLLIEMVPLASRLAEGSAGKRGAVLSNVDEEEESEIAFRKLDSIGYRVGQGLVERKQIDNLKTNHRGVYVLTDNTFRPLARMSMSSSSEAIVRAQRFLWFPCGVIRGALGSMGINATVQAETSELPAATFQIKTIAPQL